jgi:hypothetical protein
MVLKLKPWDEFTARMAGHMNQFDEGLRQHVLIAVYHRAWQREWLEGIRTDEKTKAPQLHAERIRVERMRKRLQKAIRSVRKANADGNQGFLARDYIGEAISGLEQSVRELLILENGRVAQMHPALRNKKEKTVSSNSAPEEIWSIFPGFGIAQIDQMFIQWMAQYLGNLATRKGKRLSSEEINRIISATLAAAFGELFTTDRVKTTRRRLRKRHQHPGQN